MPSVRPNPNHGAYTDRLIFNGNNLSDYCICRMERAILPSVVNVVQDIPGRHGALFRSSRLGTYIQPVHIWLRTQDRREVSEVKHRLAAMLYADEPKPLYLPDEKGLYYLAILDGDSGLGEITSDIPETTLNFLICDPIAYGIRRSARVRSYDGDTPINAGGSWPSYPLIKVLASGVTANGITITNRTTGEFIRITNETAGGIPDDSYIYIDTDAERVWLPEYDNETIGVTAESDFFTLDANTVINCYNCWADFEWRERWL